MYIKNIIFSQAWKQQHNSDVTKSSGCDNSKSIEGNAFQLPYYTLILRIW